MRKEKKMPRLIDADALMQTIMKLESWNVPDFVYESINNSPTVDAVPTAFHDRCMQIEIEKRLGMEEVVHCKDCKHYGNTVCGVPTKGYCKKTEFMTKNENDFCSWGEKK